MKPPSRRPLLLLFALSLPLAGGCEFTPAPLPPAAKRPARRAPNPKQTRRQQGDLEAKLKRLQAQVNQLSTRLKRAQKKLKQADAKKKKELMAPSFREPKEKKVPGRVKRKSRRKNRRLRPVYFEQKQPPNPMAKRLCETFYTLPAKRKGACCKQPIGYNFNAECTRVLTAAIRSKALKLRPKRIQQCLKAFGKKYQGCGWVGPFTPTPPSVCLGLFVGTLKQGKRCRSSLECTGNLYCAGVGPLQSGICAKPRAQGYSCGTAVDPLAVYTKQNDVNIRHPECYNGYCQRNRCQPRLKAGSPCKLDIQCASGTHCTKNVCQKGPLPKEGQPCSNSCAKELRCYKGKCLKPRETGQPCTSDFECRGSCAVPKGKKVGVCAKRCHTRLYFDR